jgi:carboxyl-terminal processing protease
MKNFKNWMLAGFFAFLTGVVTTMLVTLPLGAKDENIYTEIKPFMEAVYQIQLRYVDEEKTNSKTLVEGAIRGMMETLDPYSQYLDEEAFNDMTQETKGEFGGLGIEISIRNKQLTVVSPIEGTPAYRAGIKAGDIILKIEGESTDGIQLMDAVHKLRGKPGTKVIITVLREGWEEGREIKITRDIIKIRSVRSLKLDENIAYLRLNQFMETSSKDLKKELEQFKKTGVKGLILDVRNNPGGLLDSSVEIAEFFLDKGQVIVSTDGRLEQMKQQFKAEHESFWELPLVVLVNEGSASASEILAGAIQDNKKGMVVGAKTFGKGSVQTLLRLSGGGALRLTTAKYLTPKGVAIHGVGIEPDIIAEETKVSRMIVDMVEENLYAVFMKEFMTSEPTFNFEPVTRTAVNVSESSWTQLKPENRETQLLKKYTQFLRSKGKSWTEAEILKERSDVILKLKEEWVRQKKGEDEARKVLLYGDSQVQRALDILKVVNLYGGGSEKP